MNGLLRLLKWGFFCLAVGSVAIFAAMLFQPKPAIQEQVVPNTEAEKLVVQVKEPFLVEQDGDRIIWRLHAAKAEQMLDGTLRLSSPELELMSPDNTLIPIRGDTATVDVFSRQVHFSGNVQLNYLQQWQLNSEEVIYNGEADQLIIPGKFIAKGEHLTLKGDTMHIFRKEGKLSVEHGVSIKDEEPQRWLRRF